MLRITHTLDRQGEERHDHTTTIWHSGYYRQTGDGWKFFCNSEINLATPEINRIQPGRDLLEIVTNPEEGARPSRAFKNLNITNASTKTKHAQLSENDNVFQIKMSSFIAQLEPPITKKVSVL